MQTKTSFMIAICRKPRHLRPSEPPAIALTSTVLLPPVDCVTSRYMRGQIGRDGRALPAPVTQITSPLTGLNSAVRAESGTGRPTHRHSRARPSLFLEDRRESPGRPPPTRCRLDGALRLSGQPQTIPGLSGPLQTVPGWSETVPGTQICADRAITQTERARALALNVGWTERWRCSDRTVKAARRAAQQYHRRLTPRLVQGKARSESSTPLRPQLTADLTWPIYHESPRPRAAGRDRPVLGESWERQASRPRRSKPHSIPRSPAGMGL